VTFGEDEAVPVWLDRVGGVEAQVALPQRVRHRGNVHGGAGMPRVRLLYGVHAQPTNGVDRQCVEIEFDGGHDGSLLSRFCPDLSLWISVQEQAREVDARAVQVTFLSPARGGRLVLAGAGQRLAEPENAEGHIVRTTTSEGVVGQGAEASARRRQGEKVVAASQHLGDRAAHG